MCVKGCVGLQHAVLGHAADGQQLQLDAARRVFVDGQPVGVGRHCYGVGGVERVGRCSLSRCHAFAARVWRTYRPTWKSVKSLGVGCNFLIVDFSLWYFFGDDVLSIEPCLCDVCGHRASFGGVHV